MPLFAIPLPTTATPPPPRLRHFSNPRTTRKRKRASSPTPSPSSSDDDDKPTYDDHEHYALPAASTNPLSLTPAEVAQYKLAGLELDEPLPSTQIPDFPHRAFPAENRVPPRRKRSRSVLEKADEAEKDVLAKERKEKGPKLRVHHLGVLTAVLHRCLSDGDIPRATRAWSLLLRAEVGGKGLDIRSTGYWGIGAELLIRSPGEVGGDRGDGERNPGEDEYSGQGLRRWGTASGLHKAKNYFERLILQYPYIRQFHKSFTALDLWPAMLGCEIYGIQYEYQEGMRRIAAEEHEDEDEDERRSSSDESDGVPNEEEMEGEDPEYAAQERRRMRRKLRRRDRRWDEKETMRKRALAASEEIVERMDDLMTKLPYSENHTLLRLKGMLGLYIGDLSVPTRPDSEEEDKSRGPANRVVIMNKKLHAYEKGREKQAEERARARMLFEKIVQEGGRVGIDLRDLSPERDEDEDEDEYGEGYDYDTGMDRDD
ncbi:hypothetical protein BP5796_01431 [Coleophoma crateriformis]|uniref:Uncharacterized protein n=1 Tax=Coleophoma crateriformis TaxID=565419 RepID=A0A3D8T0D3_9HELO|nr:hypothetical protein BP5796_01431 [Coleophoma crateriformis]